MAFAAVLLLALNEVLRKKNLASEWEFIIEGGVGILEKGWFGLFYEVKRKHLLGLPGFLLKRSPLQSPGKLLPQAQAGSAYTARGNHSSALWQARTQRAQYPITSIPASPI